MVLFCCGVTFGLGFSLLQFGVVLCGVIFFPLDFFSFFLLWFAAFVVWFGLLTEIYRKIFFTYFTYVFWKTMSFVSWQWNRFCESQKSGRIC